METLTRDMQRALNYPEEMVKNLQQPTRRYVKNARALLRTPADIYEYPSHFSFVLDMPGLEVSNIKVKVESGVLHVSGKKKSVNKEQQEAVKAIRIERRRAKYLRKFTLPSNANADEVKATYRNGVLTVDVAKKKEENQEAKPKRLTIPIS